MRCVVENLPDDSAQWAGGGGVQAFGHAPGEVGLTAGNDGVAHGFGHEDGVLGFGNGGVHQHAIGAEFHGDGGVGSRANAGIHNHGNFGNAFTKDAEVRGILHAKAGADGCSERHNSGGARVDEFTGGDKIVVRVRENDETFLDKNARRFDKLLSVWEKRLLIANDFELDPIRKAHFSGKPRSADSFVGGVTGSRVRENKNLFAVDVVQQRFFAAVGEIHAADGNGDHVRAGGGVRAGHFLKAAILPGSNDEAGFERPARDNQIVRHGGPQEDFRPSEARGQIAG